MNVFTFVIDDPSGNSFIQNPFAPAKDPFVVTERYTRTKEQDEKLGMYQEEKTDEIKIAEKQQADVRGIKLSKEMERQLMSTYFDVSSKAVTFASSCHACHQEAETRMCIFDIPFFKEIVMMVSDCVHCGFKDSEVKPGGSMSAKGRRVTLRVEKLSDLQRDLLKSDTAGVEIPELELELVPGTLGGKYTTVEGLLLNIKDKLMESTFLMGDSASATEVIAYENFEQKLVQISLGEIPFTLILDDPMGNAFIHNVNYPDPDPQITIEDYERTQEQNDELGITYMVVENY